MNSLILISPSKLEALNQLFLVNRKPENAIFEAGRFCEIFVLALYHKVTITRLSCYENFFQERFADIPIIKGNVDFAQQFRNSF